MNSVLKTLAKHARDRLITAGEIKQTKQNTVYLSAQSSYMIVASMRKIEDDPLFLKTKKLLERQREEIIINPITHLVDKKYLSCLCEAEKEKYLLKLTKKYNEIKDYIFANNLLGEV